MSSVTFIHDHQLDPTDPLRVWVPPDPNDAYVIGADVAEGLLWGDYSCAQVLSMRTGDQVAVWHGHVDADSFGERLAELGWWYNAALIGPESNNHGLTTITTLRRISYPNIFRRRTLNKVWDTQTIEYGWKTTTVSKPLLVDELNQALRDREIALYDQGTLAELRTYVRDDKGKMHGSPHDDRVIALGIANQMRKYAYLAEHSPVLNDEYTFNWWLRQAKEADGQKAGPWVIGKHSERQPR